MSLHAVNYKFWPNGIFNKSYPVCRLEVSSFESCLACQRLYVHVSFICISNSISDKFISRNELITIYRENTIYNRRNHTICERCCFMARRTIPASCQLSTNQFVDNNKLANKSNTEKYFRHTFTESNVNILQPAKR